MVAYIFTQLPNIKKLPTAVLHYNTTTKNSYFLPFQTKLERSEPIYIIKKTTVSVTRRWKNIDVAKNGKESKSIFLPVTLII